MNKQKITLSAATVASAISAIGAMGQHGVKIDIQSAKDTADPSLAQVAVSSSQAQNFIRSNLPAIAHTIRLDGALLSEKYLQVAQQDPRPLNAPLTTDSTIDWFNNNQDRYQDEFFTECYSNCHAACHGSRGWR